VLLNQLAVMALLPGMIRLLGYELHVFSIMLFPVAGRHSPGPARAPVWRLAGRPRFRARRRRHHGCRAAGGLQALGVRRAHHRDRAGIADLQRGRAGARVRSVRRGGNRLVFFMSFGPGLALLALVARRWPGFLGKPRDPKTRAQFGQVEAWVRPTSPLAPGCGRGSWDC
jgi:hypothetical protein